MDETTDHVLAAYAQVTTGITLLPRQPDAPGVQEATLRDISFADTQPLPWTRTVGDTYGRLRMTRLYRKETA